MIIERVSLEEWNKLSESAHLVAFGEVRPASMNTFDYALVGFNDKQILGYATVIEMNKDTAYLQHGGAMPGVKGTALSYRYWEEGMKVFKQQYSRLLTKVKNTNIPMLKFNLKQGFLINGIDFWKDECLLHMQWEKNEPSR